MLLLDHGFLSLWLEMNDFSGTNSTADESKIYMCQLFFFFLPCITLSLQVLNLSLLIIVVLTLCSEDKMLFLSIRVKAVELYFLCTGTKILIYCFQQ